MGWTDQNAFQFQCHASKCRFSHLITPSPPHSVMIHSVFFWLKNDLPAEQRAIFESELVRLKEIHYLVHGFVGKPAPTEKRPVVDHSFDYSLTLHFKNLADHEHYQTK